MVCVMLVCLAVIASCEVSVGQCLRRVRPSCPGSPRAAPCLPPTAPCRSKNYNLNGAYRYERNLEGIISKLVNALIYTSIYKCSTGSSDSGGSGAATGRSTGGGISGGTESSGSAGGGSTGSGTGIAGGGNNSGGGSGGSGDALDRFLSSLLSVDLALGGTDVLNVDVLGSDSNGGSSGGGSTGSSGSAVSGGTDRTVSNESDDLLNKIYNSLLKLEVDLGKQEKVGGGGSGSGGREGSGSGSSSGGRGGVGGAGSGGQLDGLLDLLNLELDLGNTDVLDVSVLGNRSSSGNLDRNILSLLLLGANQGSRSGN